MHSQSFSVWANTDIFNRSRFIGYRGSAGAANVNGGYRWNALYFWRGNAPGAGIKAGGELIAGRGIVGRSRGGAVRISDGAPLSATLETDGIQVRSIDEPTTGRTIRSTPYRDTADATLEWTCIQTDSLKRATMSV